MASSHPAYGYEEIVGVGIEAAYGALTGLDRWLVPTSCTLKREDVRMPMSGPTGSNISFRYNATVPRHYRTVKMVRGNLTFEADYDTVGFFLANALEAPATTGGAAPYTHEFQLVRSSVSQATPNSVSIARLNGVGDWLFLGCMIDALEISGTPDSIVSVSCDIVGKSGGDATVDDDPTEGYSAAPWVEFGDSDWRANTTTPGTVSASLTSQTAGKNAASWSFRVENNLRVAPATGLSGQFIREPIYMGQRRAILTLSRDWFDATFTAKFFEDVAPWGYMAGAIKCTASEICGGTTPYSMDMYMPYALVMSPPPDYGGGADILPETITLEAAVDSSTSVPATVTLINASAASAYTTA